MVSFHQKCYVFFLEILTSKQMLQASFSFFKDFKEKEITLLNFKGMNPSKNSLKKMITTNKLKHILLCEPNKPPNSQLNKQTSHTTPS